MMSATLERVNVVSVPAAKVRNGIRGNVESWPLTVGSRRCVCVQCGDGFNSVTAFDRHQSWQGDNVVCLTEAAMIAKGWERLPDGWWVTSRREMGP